MVCNVYSQRINCFVLRFTYYSSVTLNSRPIFSNVKNNSLKVIQEQYSKKFGASLNGLNHVLSYTPFCVGCLGFCCLFLLSGGLFSLTLVSAISIFFQPIKKRDNKHISPAPLCASGQSSFKLRSPSFQFRMPLMHVSFSISFLNMFNHIPLANVCFQS